MENYTINSDKEQYKIVNLQNVELERFNNNTTLFCQLDAVPPVSEYLAGINVYGITLFTLSGAAALIVLIMYIDTLQYIMKNSPSSSKTYSAFVLGVYPVTAIAKYCALIAPRAHLLSEAISQMCNMCAMYQFFCLLIAYCGGEAKLIGIIAPKKLNTNTGPCCCWPFCSCLPVLDINKKNIKILRVLVLQLPVIQGIIYLILLVIWTEKETLQSVNHFYTQPVIIFSILVGIWGLRMTVLMLRERLKGYSIFAKFFILQMVLIFNKMQTFAMLAVFWAGWFPCTPPITPTVYKNLLFNSLILLEMILLSVIARILYKKELPSISKNNNTISGCVVSAHVCTIENIMKGSVSMYE